MSKCPVCQSRKVVRVSILKNEYLCKKCSSELKLLRKNQTSNTIEYLPSLVLLALILLPFVTGNDIYSFIAFGFAVLLTLIYFLFGRRVVYQER